MKAKKLTGYFFILICLCSACKKKDQEKTIATIDVSRQWSYDPSGFLLSSPRDEQWQMKTFTTEELNLFNTLDTANLSGTAAINSTLSNNILFPNPFSSVYAFSLKFTPAFSGQIILKSVIVDSVLNPQFKYVTRLNVSNGNTIIQINPTLSTGRFRLYFTMSSQSTPNFYRSWGNIQKIQ